MRRSMMVAAVVYGLGVAACDDNELSFPKTSTGTGNVTGDAGSGGDNATGSGGTGSTGSGGASTSSSSSSGGAGGGGASTSSSSSSGGTGGGSSSGGAGGGGASTSSSSSSGGTGGGGGWVPVGQGPACLSDADCAGLQAPPFARCWTPAQNGNNTCIECVPADHTCPPGFTSSWICPLEYDNPGPCGLIEQTETTLRYCCHEGP